MYTICACPPEGRPALPTEISMRPGSFCRRQALCTEASLRALRRRYPQIYKAEQKLLLDPRQVSVDRRDFLAAFSAIVPASHRSAAAHARWAFQCHDAVVCHTSQDAP